MMRSSVVAHDTCTVNTKYHMQVLQRYVMHDVIVRPLQESGVDITVRHHACLRQTGAERHRVSFGDTHIEHPFRQLFLHDTHAATRRHCRRDTHYLLVLLRQLQQGLAKHLLPKRLNSDI